MKIPNVVVIGGGTGLSNLLSGLKVFPVNISAVVAVTDDGGSTGKLREIYNIPAMGDIRKVLTSLSASADILENVLEYRMDKLDDHTIGNLILTALIEQTGSLVEATKLLSKVLKINGKVLPAINENSILEGVTESEKIITGETNIDKYPEQINYIRYQKNPTVSEEVIKAYQEADLIVLSTGSLFTSIIPPIIPEQAKEAILKSKAKKMYVCNAMTSSEVSNYKASDFIKKLNQHMGQEFLDAILCNNDRIPEEIQKLYLKENARPVECDGINIDNVDIITDGLITYENNVVRHKPFKVASHIFTYILSNEEI